MGDLRRLHRRHQAHHFRLGNPRWDGRMAHNVDCVRSDLCREILYLDFGCWEVYKFEEPESIRFLFTYFAINFLLGSGC